MQDWKLDELGNRCLGNEALWINVRFRTIASAVEIVAAAVAFQAKEGTQWLARQKLIGVDDRW